MADKILKELTLKIWRQKDAKSKGEFKTYKVHNISTGTSFLEMLDILNEQLVEQNEEPVAFDHDCREGICGTCSLFVDGRAHGPDDDVTTCQLHMRRFEDGATITIEPWRCGAFPVIKDLIVDRKAYDKILQAGGYVSVSTGGVPDANAQDVVTLCYSGKYTESEMMGFVRGKGGLVAHLGTSNAIEVEKRIEEGDSHAKLVYDGMLYSNVRAIGALAAAADGKIDRIILTGGLAHSKYVAAYITKKVSFIAPVEVRAGEFELEALAAGACRVLDGEEKAKDFSKLLEKA